MRNLALARSAQPTISLGPSRPLGTACTVPGKSCSSGNFNCLPDWPLASGFLKFPAGLPAGLPVELVSESKSSQG